MSGIVLGYVDVDGMEGVEVSDGAWVGAVDAMVKMQK